MNVHLISARQPGAPANFSETQIKPVDDAPSSDATRQPSTTGAVLSAIFQNVVNRALTPKNAVAATPELNTHREIIYKSGRVTPPSNTLTINEREQRVEGYANRVVNKINAIERGSDGERNINFQNVRLFMEPSGYFSGGLLAAGFDPHEKITVTFDAYVGMGSSKTLASTDQRTYLAWEIAAGALAHDKVGPGGAINFHSMTLQPKDRRRVKDLEAVGKTLQRRWENNVSAPMREASGALAQRSGKADAYGVRGTLQSLRSDKDRFEKLSPEGQEAVKRTLDRNGQVIIPNVYGFPLGGYAFVPYTPYDGNYEHRPNQGIMIDLKNGALHEMHGDEDFAGWAKNNRSELIRSFNARDRQGGQDAHWPKAQHVLDSLILGHTSHYPGYYSFFSDQQISVRETFNYTRSRGGDYQLKYGNLNNGVASKYQAVNANNAVWSDRTEVFGASQQGWKTAKDLWGNTFGYIPFIGTTGNIAFGVHDSLYGMTASDRIGGSSAAVISGLQLAHELAPVGVGAGLGEPPLGSATANNYRWNYSPQTHNFEFVRAPEPVASFAGMREVEFSGNKYFVTETPDAGDGHYVLRVRDPKDPSKLASSGKIAKPDAEGVWRRRGVAGGNVVDAVRLPESKQLKLVDQAPARPDQIAELNLSPSGRYIATTLDQESFLPDGAYVFVVRADAPDNLYLGSVNKKLTPEGKPYPFNHRVNPDAVDGHSALTRGLRAQQGGTTDVFYAGTVHFKDGRPEFWTNASGHYEPPADLRHTNLSPSIKKMLPEDTFVDEDKMTGRQRSTWDASTSLTKAEEAEHNEYMKETYGAEDSGSDLSDDE